ncbi:hypothetical protein HC752_21905 [Vibrio sp. S9_S30]|uniref:hypothetical protein n=1 Tax=Vibrio sp. S9_S30 TaxID=2720226 RepID=UPI00168140B4|nr:hypothetical protein [Vibrio sp. S9_S30]MBD1559602.1 hypothetical protein [Vibrio sp. S9_S30]
MNYINNLGDYVELLHALLSTLTQGRAVVQYDDEPEKQGKPCPFIKLPLPEIVETSFANDGRQQDTLEVTVLIKAPKNLNKASIAAANIGGFVRGEIAQETFTNPQRLGEHPALASEHRCVDTAVEIQGYPLKWETNDHGYAIKFEQTIRYGSVDHPAFILNAIDVSESGETERVYERDTQTNPEFS